MAFRFVFLVLCVFEGGITVLANDVVPEGVQNARGCSFFATDRAKRHIYNDIMPISCAQREREQEQRKISSCCRRCRTHTYARRTLAATWMNYIVVINGYLVVVATSSRVKTLINTRTFSWVLFILFLTPPPPHTTACVLL
jgi:hypothetical protein